MAGVEEIKDTLINEWKSFGKFYFELMSKFYIIIKLPTMKKRRTTLIHPKPDETKSINLSLKLNRETGLIAVVHGGYM